ncbi:ADP-ribosylation factor-like protein 5B [Paramacrobiotus metropolitanus]|uniref:ADP-ribosylation factor-like protein 5B n=1 Tax=Paramacrobiotus metropolitanus TaxID=2943436 RepID=UPI002445966C|nr:ADP-ribosylation factor-like protein 5B [Paramacrobiotus metropolitanus]
MGILFAKLWNMFSGEEHKVLILGLDNAGKTTILYQLTMREVVHTTPTIGSNVEELKWKNMKFVMWDLAGQDSLRPSWTCYYSGTQFIVLVVDCMDRDRVPLVKEELYKILAHEDLRKANLLVFANKQDLKGAMSASELSSLLNLTSIKTHRWQIQACSALTGEGLFKGLEWMANHVTR